MTSSRQRKSRGTTPPHSHDAEQAVLGAMLTSVEAIGSVCETLQTAKALYSPSHGKIFDAIIDLHDKNKPVDITTVGEELERRGCLDDCGGRTYLTELASGVATAANARYYAAIVFGKWQLRRTIEAAGEIISDCLGQKDEPELIIDQAEQRIFEIADRRQVEEFIQLGKIMPDLFIRLSDIHDAGGGLIGASSGFRDLDEILAGFQRGNYYVLAGRPSMGKSALAMNICDHFCRGSPDQAAAIFSLEMNKLSLAQRALCGEARINSREAERGRIGPAEWRKLAEAVGRLNELKIFVDSSASITPIQMRGKLRRLASRHKVGLVVVDYMQLMDADRSHENRQQEITNISRRLKAIALEFDVPVLALSQLSRAVEARAGSKRPQLSDLRESGSIEQDADVVMFIYRPEYYMQDLKPDDPDRLKVKGKAEVIVAKQRNGPTGSVWLYFNREFTRFENLATEEIYPAQMEMSGKSASAGDEPF